MYAAGQRPARDWVIPEPVDVPPELLECVGGHPLLAQTLVRRGLSDPQRAAAFLDPDAYTPAPATDLPDLAAAADRVELALSRGERILVWGDFDVDGQTATAVLVAVLTDLGGNVGYRVPVRGDESHGLNLPALERFLDQDAGLLITCDTGVTDHEPIDYAMGRGVDVIVTDHHELPEVLPGALAVVNPKRLAEDHPLRELSGVGVAYKLVEELCRRAGRPELAEQHLDLVALGLVADLALQVDDVRYLIQRGLAALRTSRRLGLRALMEVAQVQQDRLNDEHISFALAPRMNAVGRLADANVAVELLLTNDLTRARILAQELEALNVRRQLLSEQVFQAAQAQIEADPSLLSGSVLVLSDASWPPGVIGIVASRLVDRYQMPTIMIALPEGALARGSARSVPGCNITAAIAELDDLLEGFGGHPMAAGLRLPQDNLPQFVARIQQSVRAQLGHAPEPPKLHIDGELTLADLTAETAQDLGRLEPLGPGNPRLTVMVRDLTLKGHSLLGRSGGHVQAFVQDAGSAMRRILWWGGSSDGLPDGPFDLALSIRLTDFRGQPTVQLEWVDSRPAENRPSEVARPTTEMVDLRPYEDPRQVLAELSAGAPVQVWAEVDRPEGSVTREALAPGRPLVVWSVPPGPEELRHALALVSPSVTYLFAQDPGVDDRTAFISRLMGLTRYVLRQRQGRTTLAGLAAAMGHREATVQAGLDWLQVRGDLAVEADGGTLHLAPGVSRGNGESATIARLDALLAETRAWRAYYATADPESLLRE